MKKKGLLITITGHTIPFEKYNTGLSVGADCIRRTAQTTKR
jgi:hypothetical protein